MPRESDESGGPNHERAVWRLQGWAITGWAFLLLSVLVGSILLRLGWSAETLHVLLRITARTSLLLFLLAFSASSLHGLLRRSWSAWLLRNRRYVGVSFAVSHGWHALGLLALARWFPHPFLDTLPIHILVGGSIGFAVIAAMTATSFDRSRRWLGQRRWRLLHTTGSYYLWGIFAFDYLGLAVANLIYAPVAMLVLGVVVLRGLHRSRRRDGSHAVLRSPEAMP